MPSGIEKVTAAAWVGAAPGGRLARQGGRIEQALATEPVTVSG
jgi:hypothetical protein